MLAPLVALLLLQGVRAQTRFVYSNGQSASPAYEGWWPNEDGSFEMFFGYMNSNWLQELDIPVGPDNNIQPGGPDQGQPTHFYPRRNPFLFTIRVPKDFGSKELIWTLTANGKTEHTYASLKSDYLLDKQVISTEVGGDNGSLADALRTNIPPELRVEGDKNRSVKVGEPLTLVAFARDPDGLPAKRGAGGRGAQAPAGRGQAAGATRGQTAGEVQAGGAAQVTGAGAQAGVGRGQGAGRAGPPNAATIAPRPPTSLAAGSSPGLRLSWIVFRGKAAVVTFNPDQMKTWEDTRVFANSPWSPGTIIPDPPSDGKWLVQVTFLEPGAYVLRAIASDGSLFTNDNVTVNVVK